MTSSKLTPPKRRRIRARVTLARNVGAPGVIGIIWTVLGVCLEVDKFAQHGDAGVQSSTEMPWPQIWTGISFRT